MAGSNVSELDGIQKAATLLITLGPEKASEIFKHLKEDEIEQLTLEIANTRSVSPASISLRNDTVSFSSTRIMPLPSMIYPDAPCRFKNKRLWILASVCSSLPPVAP